MNLAEGEICVLIAEAIQILVFTSIYYIVGGCHVGNVPSGCDAKPYILVLLHVCYVFASGSGSEFVPAEPTWIPAVAASAQQLASAICAAQGSDYDPAVSDACSGQERGPSPTLITLTADISLKSSRLPQIWGQIKIQGGCGGAGGR
eukprot:scaffold396977_cov35-Prasinocladus_malaysianus.AAC.1